MIPRPDTTIDGLTAVLAAGGVRLVRLGGGGELPLAGVSLDSRRVGPGFLYAALPGERFHGAQFAAEAVAAGASAILTDERGRELLASGPDVPILIAAEPRAALGRASAFVYGTDASKPILFGVTGTNGKTTTTFILDALLRALGYRTGLIGTIETRIGDETVRSVRTTPESPDLHALLARMQAESVTACSMEVSSHALSLHRVDGAVFDVAAFTNLSQDHLDFHGTMEEYFEAKASLFTPERSRRGVVVVDDDWGRRLAARSAIDVVTLASSPAGGGDYWIEADDADAASSGANERFVLRGPGGLWIPARAPLPGDFNRTNTALAMLLLISAGIGEKSIARVSEEFSVGVPGRMELIRAAGPRAVVDYSHTPDSVAHALAALSATTRGPLVIVLGAGGDRDRGKREGMGLAAARGADVVIVTDDNPRSEEPVEIRARLLAGAASAGGAGRAREILEIGERAAAIEAGLEAAGTDGTVLIAGKGHEQGQEIDGVVFPFDDRSETRAALARLNGSANDNR